MSKGIYLFQMHLLAGAYLLDGSSPLFNATHIDMIADIITGCNQVIIRNKFAEIDEHVKSIAIYDAMDQTLNDDCIMEIIPYIDLKNIVEFCIFSHRFYYLATRAYRNVVINIDMTNKMSTIYRALFFIKPPGFGQKIKYLHIKFNPDSICCDFELVRIIDSIIDTLGTQITEIKVSAPLNGFDREWLTKISSLRNFSPIVSFYTNA